jgi:hypothetical protein
VLYFTGVDYMNKNGAGHVHGVQLAGRMWIALRNVDFPVLDTTYA